jgi:hypothetical protein
MEFARRPLDHHEIVMQAPSTHEGTLVSPHHLRENWGNPICQNFRHPLGDAVNETDRPKVSHFFCPWLLGEKCYQCSIYSPESTAVEP